MVTDEQLTRIRRLALKLAGIELAERHRELLERRSRRSGIRDAGGWDTLLKAAEAGEPSATRQLLGLVTTGFTGFLRHPRHFEVATAHSLRAVQERGRARLWSAAAATGEEAWSLALALIEGFERDDPPVGILATDIDQDALAVAARGEYTGRALSQLEPGRRSRYFTRVGETDRWRVIPAMRRLAEFRVLNLVGPAWTVEGPFDVVFCRNVLMYLEAGHRQSVLGRIASLLAPDGLLMLDPAEHLGRAEPLFASAGAGLFVRRTGSRSTPAGPLRAGAWDR